MFDQNTVALAGTTVRRMQDISRYEDRVARPRRRSLRRARAAAPSAPQFSGELGLQC
jgi:hypothetical protein